MTPTLPHTIVDVLVFVAVVVPFASFVRQLLGGQSGLEGIAANRSR